MSYCFDITINKSSRLSQILEDCLALLYRQSTISCQTNDTLRKREAKRVRADAKRGRDFGEAAH